MAGTADVHAQLTFAWYLQSVEAFDAAIIPELQAEEYPYLYTDAISMHLGDSSYQGDKLAMKHFDFKPGRFIGTGRTLAFVVENTSDDVVTITYHINSRMLLWHP